VRECSSEQQAQNPCKQAPVLDGSSQPWRVNIHLSTTHINIHLSTTRFMRKLERSRQKRADKSARVSKGVCRHVGLTSVDVVMIFASLA